MTENNYDFRSFSGKQISVDDYFFNLTKMEWKYDTEESNLFNALSKTFWEKAIKVSIVLEEFCCVSPNNERTTVESIRFYSFDKNIYKEKNIYTEFEKEHKNDEGSDFKTVEEYITFIKNDNPYYIPFADFNTEDCKLLTEIEVQNVPIEIQKHVWEDLHSIKSLKN